MKRLLTRLVLLLSFIVVALLTFNVSSALTAESLNMELVGTNDLQARSTYQPIIQRQGNRWILYAGHHAVGTNPVTGARLPSFNPLTGRDEPNGVSIVDVTDPKKPVYLHHLPVGTTGNGGAQMVRVCPGSTLPIRDNKFYLLRSYANSAHEIWDVTNPASPQPVRTVAGGNPVIGAAIGAAGALDGTHKSWWECDSGIAYIVGERGNDVADGWRDDGNHIFVFDLSNPADPKFIRDWALDGHQPGGQLPPHFDEIPSIHGPISTGRAGNRIYFAYGTGDNGVMQIVDRSKLLPPPLGTGVACGSIASSLTPPACTDFTTAEVGRWVMNPVNGAHTSFPLGKIAIPDWGASEENVRDFVAVVSESTANECTEPRHLTYFVDVTDEGRPQSQSNHQVLASSSPFNFCDRGGRFGPHSTNEDMGPPFYQKIVFITYFNAGVRAVDIRDPFNPKEVGFYIPDPTANTDFRCATINGVRSCQQTIQTNNVETDARGFIYPVDRANTGLHILQLTGAARRILED